MADNPYKMTISLNVLNHLGINLYSNIPAVLSEIVANSWDADADEVSIWIKSEEGLIEIVDNGQGMSVEDINKRYLHVGYQKRKDPDFPERTPKYKRIPMGRKGIGKLSVFSIADFVEVHSVKNGEKNGFVMKSEDIKQKIKDQAENPSAVVDYKPDAVSPGSIRISKGTRILLKSLKKNIKSTATFSRKKLARRFSVIDNAYNFKVSVNDEEISVQDRDYFSKLEFIWFLGSESVVFADSAKNAKKKIKFNNQLVVGPGQTTTVKGWIGTFDEHKNVDINEDYNSIVLLARGKLIHEDVLSEFKEGRVFSKYLIGEIQADFLDDDDKDDIITSDRQRIKENDERWKILKDYIESIIKDVGNKWTEYRNEISEEKALLNPAIERWFKKLRGNNKRVARKLFGKIEGLPIPDTVTKRELYKTSILAFEKLALKDNLEVLNHIEKFEDFEFLKTVLKGIDEIEETHYYHITKGRLEVIDTFKKISTPETKEKVFQNYLFEHLWLLHPSWERAAYDPHIESTVNSIFKKEFIENAKLNNDEKLARFDMAYRTVAGKNVIIELKRYGRKIQISELSAQVAKYRGTLEKVLKTQFPDSPNLIEIICILGAPPEPIDEDKRNREKLAVDGARYITYDTLIEESLNSYSDYLKKQKEISEIIKIIEEI